MIIRNQFMIRRALSGVFVGSCKSRLARCFSENTVTVRWKLKDGEIVDTKAKMGDNLLTVAHKNNIDMEGACGGVSACSTCHVILPDELFDALPEASEEEEDMLDLAAGLTCSSRLGCQVEVTPAFEGCVIKLPSVTRNFYVDGHVPKPH